MKKWLLLIPLVIAGFLGFIFFLTNALTNASDQFFALVRSQKTLEAYQSTSSVFQQEMDFQAFNTFLGDTALNKYESATWNSRSVQDETGLLIGSITTTEQDIIPLRIDFLKQDGSWKISNIQFPRESGNTDTVGQSIPSDAEINVLVHQTMIAFVKATGAKNFDSFYEDISAFWKPQTTPQALKELFSEFVDQDIDLTFVTGSSPTLSAKPVIDENGVLVVEGYYPSKDLHLVFSLKYLYEHPFWKLVGIHVKAEQ